MTTLLGELHRRVPEWTYERDEDSVHHRFSGPGNARVVEVEVRVGLTVVEAWAFTERLVLEVRSDRPADLVLDALERFGAVPQAVAQ